MAKTAIAGLAVAAVTAGVLLVRHPLLRIAAGAALEQELAGARRGL